MRAPSGIAPVVLRVGAIVLLVVSQARTTPAPGLSGLPLAVTLLTATLVLSLLVALLEPAWHTHRAARHRLATPSDLPPLPNPAPRSPAPGEAARAGGSVPAESAERAVFGVPVTVIALGVAVVSAAALNAVTRSSTAAVIGLFLCVITAVTRHPLKHSLPVGVLAVTGLLVADLLAGAFPHDLTLVLTVCLIFFVSYAAKQRSATRAAEAREAVLAERARIAREIHDILAHSLSAQLVHLEGAKLLLRAERTDEALDRVTRARDLARTGLEEARRAVAALREDPPALPAALRALAEEFESAAHQPCTLRVAGPERRLAPQTELALLRTAQEALTNVRRHAPGCPVTVELTFGPSWCDLRVTNPVPAEKGPPGGGYGLMGMRERAELLGGALSAEEWDGGFHVSLKVPAARAGEVGG
ncbi:sensor histidine kinase [Actinomadura luzonensis]|uniref:sensor histidine kinase n=1 Tax=Actinomadura luzonensis TaxID=2805427 RepID=UPI002676FE16|nr:histidine kinase [Actinomadura luzonensis]